MRNWLKKFAETSVGMLFSDQHLHPTEVVRIAQSEADKMRRCGTVCDDDAPATAPQANGDSVRRAEPVRGSTHLIGLR